MAADWQQYVLSATDALFKATLGPEIAEDAKAYCPVCRAVR
jgi:hypothetical protein